MPDTPLSAAFGSYRFCVLHIPAGAHEHREAPMVVCQADRYRGLAVLVRSYRKHFNSDGYFIFDEREFVR